MSIADQTRFQIAVRNALQQFTVGATLYKDLVENILELATEESLRLHLEATQEGDDHK